MARHRDYGKESHWLDLVLRWRQSSLGVHAFCERHGLREANFYLWRRVLRQRGLIPEEQPVVPAASEIPAFLKVTVDSGTSPNTSAPLELVLPRGRVLRVPPGFDADLLRQLLGLLEEPSC